MAQFRVTSAKLQGAVFALDGEYFTVGREADNHIQIPHPSVSKHHAMLTVDQGDYKFWDLHSTNGTYINGERTVFQHLRDGDRLVLGEIELHFELNATVPAQPPAPVAISLSETQLLTGTVRKPSSRAAQVRPVTPTGPPSVATLVSVITPVDTPVAPPRKLTGFLSPLRPPAVAPATHHEMRQTLARPATSTCVEIPSSDKPVMKVEANASVPAPVAPAPVKAELPVKLARQRLAYSIALIAGGIMLGTGYSAHNDALRFAGFLTAITAFFALVFSLRFGGIIAPPRD